MKLARLSLTRFLLLWTLPFALLGAVAWFYPVDQLDLFPSEYSKLALVSDSVYGGQSKGTMVKTSSMVVVEYQLEEQNRWPLMMLRVDRQGKWEVDRYNELHIQINTEPQQRIPVFLTASNHPWPDGRRGTVRLRNSFRTEPDKTLYVMEIDKFEVDGYWYKSNRVSESLDEREVLPGVDGMFMETSETAEPGAEGWFEIRSIRLVNNPRPILWIAFYVLAGIQLLLLLIYLFYRKYRIRLVVVPYEQKEATSIKGQDFARIQEYLARNYDKDVNAKQIWKETGIAHDRIARMVKENTGQTLRGYLNTLRLTEAKRLLAETDLPVGDIAYRVGYGTSTHFHRVFKETEGMTPLEHRSKHEKAR